MRPRISHSATRTGEYSHDHGGPAPGPLLHYMLAADWGTLTLRVEPPKVFWFPKFYSLPDWDEIEEWLGQVEKGMSEAYSLDPSGLTERCLMGLQLDWRDEVAGSDP